MVPVGTAFLTLPAAEVVDRPAALTHRPLEDTLRDALEWEEAWPQHPHGAGLTDDDERDLLHLLDHT